MTYYYCCFVFGQQLSCKYNIHANSSFFLCVRLLAVMSEDMIKDGYEDIMNVDISCVAIEMMRRKYEHVPQLKCIRSTNQLLLYCLLY